ncbi:MAG: efflux RND transporter periplasmic adaptor subunit [Isosphaeraceae bacterium]
MSTDVHDSPVAPAADEAPPTRLQKFRMLFKVIELRLRFVALMAATGLTFGYWDTIWNHYEKWARPTPAGTASAVDPGVEHYCPMHPNVVRAEPGSCPICGMPLSKRRKGEAETLPAGVVSRVSLSPLRVAQAGIRTVGVGYEPLAETVTTVGTVEFDERGLARIASKTRGMARVESLHVNFTGTAVKAGEPLAEVYSPELYQAVQELLLAHRRASEPTAPRSPLAQSVLGDSQELVRLGREKLVLWGMTPEQVDGILARGRAEARLPVLSPIGGVVVRKGVVAGQYVAEGETLFEVADLSHVWVQAQVYEDQLALVRVGQSVEAAVGAFPGEVFRGTVAFIDPALNPATRTVQVRYDLGNPDGRLRPGMFATVTLRTPFSETPAFRSRNVAARAETPEAQKICPVTTLKLGSMGRPVAVDVQGRKVWACCEGCTPKLQSQPAKYLARIAAAPANAVLSVPESAVVDTGTRKVVYVETEPGVFEGREVVLGPRSGDRYPVLEGVSPGEKVAAAGSFLIDAETRLNPATGAKPAPAPPAPPPHQHDDPAARPAPRTAAAGDAGDGSLR